MGTLYNSIEVYAAVVPIKTICLAIPFIDRIVLRRQIINVMYIHRKRTYYLLPVAVVENKLKT